MVCPLVPIGTGLGDFCSASRTTTLTEAADFQNEIWNITLDGELAVCPAHKTAKRVLDMGTGTGVWAIDYGTKIRNPVALGR